MRWETMLRMRNEERGLRIGGNNCGSGLDKTRYSSELRTPKEQFFAFFLPSTIPPSRTVTMLHDKRAFKITARGGRP